MGIWVAHPHSGYSFTASRLNWNLEMVVWREENRRTRKKNPRSKDENQQQTQPTYEEYRKCSQFNVLVIKQILTTNTVTINNNYSVGMRGVIGQFCGPVIFTLYLLNAADSFPWLQQVSFPEHPD